MEIEWNVQCRRARFVGCSLINIRVTLYGIFPTSCWYLLVHTDSIVGCRDLMVVFQLIVERCRFSYKEEFALLHAESSLLITKTKNYVNNESTKA